MTRVSRREFLHLAAATLAAALLASCRQQPEATGMPPATATHLPATTAPATPTNVNAVLPSPTRPATKQPSPTAPAAKASGLSLHPFIEAHPQAVFIRRTQVTSKTDAEAKQLEGISLARSLFSPGATPGLSFSSQLAIKANLTCAEGMGNTEAGMGILTDAFFVEGFIEGLTGQGFPSERISLREGNWLGGGYCPSDFKTSGYPEMAQRRGIHLTDFPTGRQADELEWDNMTDGDEIIWKEVPDGVVLKRIPYVAPFNAPDAWLLDIAKLKTHGMGVTLSVKNLQGMIVPPYTRFCEGVENTLRHSAAILENFQPDLEEHVEQLYRRHLQEGYPRWGRPGRTYDSGYGMEMWCQRTCDSLSVSPVGLAMVEGIYGRSSAFMEGPGPDGTAQDFLMNLVIFGKNPFLVDLIAAWLAGHEPGNLGLFHIARERGLLHLLNPRDVELYLWEEEPRPAVLESFERTPLLTYYLRKDYAGQNEEYWHMLDEPFDYKG